MQMARIRTHLGKVYSGTKGSILSNSIATTERERVYGTKDDW